MNTLKCKLSKRRIRLNHEPFALGGEGKIYDTDYSNCVAKIYERMSKKQFLKLSLMIARPPKNPASSRGHVSLAFPTDILLNALGKPVGFLMPKIPQGEVLHKVCIPKTRIKLAPDFNWKYLHVSALNFALTMASLHEHGYIIGDIKTVNVLVNSRALVSIVDCDSFQVKDRDRHFVFHCDVGSEGFTAPELLNGRSFDKQIRDEAHDCFGLGVVIFYLLFGCHPYQGRYKGRGNTPELDESVKSGDWIFNPRSKVQASPATMPIEVLHPEIRDGFIKCFTRGHKISSYRPTAKDWVKILRRGIQDLNVCRDSNSHVYSNHYGNCQWCELKKKTGFEFFPSRNKVPKSPLIRNKPTAIARIKKRSSRTGFLRRCRVCSEDTTLFDFTHCPTCDKPVHYRCLAVINTREVKLFSKTQRFMCPVCNTKFEKKNIMGLNLGALFGQV